MKKTFLFLKSNKKKYKKILTETREAFIYFQTAYKIKRLISLYGHSVQVQLPPHFRKQKTHTQPSTAPDTEPGEPPKYQTQPLISEVVEDSVSEYSTRRKVRISWHTS